tara:strand:- start:750 stop:941 length:192 start_codon:yes stop_codon:yes gene_type:complete
MKFSVNRSDGFGFSTMSQLFDTEEEAEAEVSKQRKEEPEAEFWSELFTSLVGWNPSVNQEKGE